VAVERDDELVGHLVSDGIASAATPQHVNTLEELRAARKHETGSGPADDDFRGPSQSLRSCPMKGVPNEC
jgi:hypothetical protein